MGASFSKAAQKIAQHPVLGNKWLWLTLGALIAFKLCRRKRSIKTPARKILDEYDYIVVGSGSAGSVVAARLSEIPDVRVLVVEAGADDDTDLPVRVPMTSGLLQGSSKDWAFVTEKQEKSCLQNIGEVSKWPRGKITGGSSCLNYMIYVRGHQADYDHWKKELGCEGWGWDDLLPYFKKSEDCRVPWLKGSPYHGVGGGLTVSEAVTPRIPSRGFVEAAVEAGMKRNPDYNSGDSIGVSIGTNTTRDSERCSTAKAFLRPAIHARPNQLHLLTKAQVTRVLFNERKEAVGVSYISGGVEKKVFAKKEVILCAGAVQSPQLLMLSGIGNQRELKDLGIDVIHSNPNVGENLRDHLFTGMTFESKVESIKLGQLGLKTILQGLEYFFCKKGPLASTMLEATAFHHTGVRPDIKSPDLQLQFFPAQPPPLKKDDNNFGVKPEYFVPQGDGYRFTILPTLLHPKSIGYIKLRSSNPLTPPIIQPNYLTDEEGADIGTFIAGMRLCQKISRTQEFQKFGGAMVEPPWMEGCGELKDSDAWWDFYIRHSAVTVYHPVGTCAMGPSDSKTAVVNPRLQVIGVSRLRVIDASIMPTLVSGNTNAPCVMIGEKGAALIIEDNRENRR